MHNHASKSVLDSENILFVSYDYFSLETISFWIVATDSWKAYWYHLHHKYWDNYTDVISILLYQMRLLGITSETYGIIK